MTSSLAATPLVPQPVRQEICAAGSQHAVIRAAKAAWGHLGRPEGFREILDGQFSLCRDGLDPLWGRVSPMPGNHDAKMEFSFVAKIDVACGLMMDKEAVSQESLE